MYICTYVYVCVSQKQTVVRVWDKRCLLRSILGTSIWRGEKGSQREEGDSWGCDTGPVTDIMGSSEIRMAFRVVQLGQAGQVCGACHWLCPQTAGAGLTLHEDVSVGAVAPEATDSCSLSSDCLLRPRLPVLQWRDLSICLLARLSVHPSIHTPTHPSMYQPVWCENVCVHLGILI